MEEQRQTVQDQKMDSWDDKTKKEALGYIWDVAQQVRKYLSHAIEYANTSNNESPAQFWEYLFLPNKFGNGCKIRQEKRDGDPRKPPADPYREQDVQAFCKYLYYGYARIFRPK